MQLCGIVISSMTTWRGEQTGLTLAASIIPLLSQLTYKNNRRSINALCLKSSILGKIFQSFKRYFCIKDFFSDSIDSSVVQLLSGSDWGTAILIDKKNAIFLTAAHVVPQVFYLPLYEYDFTCLWVLFRIESRFS